jgi:hypothetical protein
VRYANIAMIEGNNASQYGIGMVSARIAEMVLRDEQAAIPVGCYSVGLLLLTRRFAFGERDRPAKSEPLVESRSAPHASLQVKGRLKPSLTRRQIVLCEELPSLKLRELAIPGFHLERKHNAMKLLTAMFFIRGNCFEDVDHRRWQRDRSLRAPVGKKNVFALDLISDRVAKPAHCLNGPTAIPSELQFERLSGQH